MIFLKREYDYALRICAYLAGNYQRGPISLAEISRKLFITRPFATKIVFQLKNRGIVHTTQGKHGGVRLDQLPETITLLSILQGVGYHTSISECIKQPDFCPLPAPCKLHAFFIGQENLTVQALKSRTIAEFAFTDADFDPAKVK